MTCLMTAKTSAGPCITVTTHVPDKHYFRGSFGGKDIIPLYRDAAAQEPNVVHDLLKDLAKIVRVTGIEPNSGDALGGTYVRILGNRFTSDGARSAKIYFGGRLAAPPRFASDAEMVVEAPGGEPGKTVDVLIIFEPGGELKIANGFSYYERKTRTIEDVGTKPTPK